MKSTSTHKKAPSSPKTNHKSAPRAQNAGVKAERPARVARPEKASGKTPEPAAAAAGKPGRAARTRKGAAAAATLPDDQPKTRLALIKSRHEAIKREIDQIREDLESDEDE